jgi:hypothetical protein
MAEIRKAHELLAAASRFRLPQAAAWLLPLHSSVSAEQQRRVFQVLRGSLRDERPLTLQFLPLSTSRHSCKSGCLGPAPVLLWSSSPAELTQHNSTTAIAAQVPPAGVRKVVLATNIAGDVLCNCKTMLRAQVCWTASTQTPS